MAQIHTTADHIIRLGDSLAAGTRVQFIHRMFEEPQCLECWFQSPERGERSQAVRIGYNANAKEAESLTRGIHKELIEKIAQNEMEAEKFNQSRARARANGGYGDPFDYRDIPLAPKPKPKPEHIAIDPDKVSIVQITEEQMVEMRGLIQRAMRIDPSSTVKMVPTVLINDVPFHLFVKQSEERKNAVQGEGRNEMFRGGIEQEDEVNKCKHAITGQGAKTCTVREASVLLAFVDWLSNTKDCECALINQNAESPDVEKISTLINQFMKKDILAE